MLIIPDCLSKSNPSKQKENCQNSFRISLTTIDRIKEFTKQGYDVTRDPFGDGTCQFAVLCYALRELGINRSPDTLTIEVVQLIEKHDMSYVLMEIYWKIRKH